jgi:DNA replication and repair protein RecF
VRIDELWLTDFRSYHDAHARFAPGLTAVLGANGQGKTNLVEGLAFVATASSFRGAPTEALVRRGAEHAIVRAQGHREQRSLLIEAELSLAGRTRLQLNRQRLARSRDLLDALRVTVFSPDDLELVKGGPGERRRYLDDLLVALHPRNDRVRADVDKVLKQRNALLRQAGGRVGDDVASTLDVWDDRLARAGDALGAARTGAVDRLVGELRRAYQVVAGEQVAVDALYRPAWLESGLGAALAAARSDDLRRGVTTVGPHRDDLELSIAGLPARTHASQGEQRSLAFALRMAAHGLVTESVGTPPVLVLDDVFSELDPNRSRALLDAIPASQTVLTTAAVLPNGVIPDTTLTVVGGTLSVG